MATVTHSTPADGTFSAAGTTAWNANHTVTGLGTLAALDVAFISPGLRLTLTTAVPVTTADVTAAGTLFWTPYLSNVATVWDGAAWIRQAVTEKSLSLSVTSGKNYDVFYNGTALSLSAAWTNDTTRADALGTQDGVTVLNSDKTKLWIGTIRASGSNTTEDSGGGTTTQVGGKRFVWNAYNRVVRPMSVIDTTDSWSYTTNAFRIADAATGPLNCVEWVSGFSECLTAAVISSVTLASNTTAAAKVGIGIDSATVSSGVRGVGFNGSASVIVMTLMGRYSGLLGPGYHYAAWLESGAAIGTCTFTGDSGADGRQSGLTAEIPA